jgi:hypothetical protein
MEKPSERVTILHLPDEPLPHASLDMNNWWSSAYLLDTVAKLREVGRSGGSTCEVVAVHLMKETGNLLGERALSCLLAHYKVNRPKPGGGAEVLEDSISMG